MENSKTEVAKRKRWTPEEKTMILMRYLKDRVSAADLSDEYGVSPTLLSQWTKTLFEGAPQIFGRGESTEQILKRQIEIRDARIRTLEEVVTELSTEVLNLRKQSGGRSPAPGWPQKSPQK
ncbi:MAG: transposase [Candidatus Methanomethyliaceae archaeon]